MTAPSYADSLRQAMAQALVDGVTLGGTGEEFRLRLYNVTGTAIADIVYVVSTDISAGATGTVTIASGSATPVANGTVIGALLIDEDGNTIITMAVTATAGAGPVKLSNTSLTTSDTVTINPFTIPSGDA